MKYRNFTHDETNRFRQAVHDLLPTFHTMPLGQRFKSYDIQCVPDGNGETRLVAVCITGVLTSHMTVQVKGLADGFAPVPVEGSDCGEACRLVCVSVKRSARDILFGFSWVGTRVIDTVDVGDLLYPDGTFSTTPLAGKIPEGVVYHRNEQGIRVVSAAPSAEKLPWDKVQAGRLSPEEETDIFACYDGEVPLTDTEGIFRHQCGQAQQLGVSLRKLPALHGAATWNSRLLKGRWVLPVTGDAARIWSRELRTMLTRQLTRAGGKTLNSKCWLGVEASADRAYMMQLTTVNALLKDEPKSLALPIRPVAVIGWQTLEGWRDGKQETK